jgi:hypothetical protein
MNLFHRIGLHVSEPVAFGQVDEKINKKLSHLE